jgi:hypothetical protein
MKTSPHVFQLLLLLLNLTLKFNWYHFFKVPLHLLLDKFVNDFQDLFGH